MIDLARRISGDWIALKEKANDLYALLDVFAITARELRAEIDLLRLSVESGIVEERSSLARQTPYWLKVDGAWVHADPAVAAAAEPGMRWTRRSSPRSGVALGERVDP